MAGSQPSIRIVAGAPWPDRLVPPRPGPEANWFEPLHVRAPGKVRDAMTAQVEAGADVLLAPAWLTHRRALMEVGESRRAAEWTTAAVRVAREAAEEGASRRPEGGSLGVLVAGPLPDMERGSEPGDGRLAPRDVAAGRDLHTQVALLADAGVDLLVLEPRGGDEAARRAVVVAAETGLDVWASWSPESGPFDVWAPAVVEAGASVLLVDRTDEVASPLAEWGVLLPSGLPAPTVDAAQGWLDAGAVVLGLQEGATADSLGPLVEARGAFAGAAAEAHAAADTAWSAWVERATRAAPGGEALLLTRDDSAGSSLPPGFQWTVAPPSDLPRLPAGRFRLVVAATPSVPLPTLVRLLDEGGILLAREADDTPATDPRLRILARGDGPHPELVARREA